MALFERKETVFEKRDRAGWMAAREALRAAGIEGVRSSDYEAEPPACGCGSKLDPRDFGPGGKVDRRIYVIRVPAAQARRAREALGELGGIEKPKSRNIYG